VVAWLAKAEEDLLVARAVLEHPLPSYDAVGFHAQQAAEKALKALLVRHQVRFAKSHEIKDLLLRAEAVAPGIRAALAEAEPLTSFAVAGRYPGGEPPLDQEGAARAVEVAGKVVNRVRELLGPYLDAGRPGAAQ
jgi:HEPN domain-containing protein